jgi:hypothetical protein
MVLVRLNSLAASLFFMWSLNWEPLRWSPSSPSAASAACGTRGRQQQVGQCMGHKHGGESDGAWQQHMHVQHCSSTSDKAVGDGPQLSLCPWSAHGNRPFLLHTQEPASISQCKEHTLPPTPLSQRHYSCCCC